MPNSRHRLRRTVQGARALRAAAALAAAVAAVGASALTVGAAAASAADPPPFEVVDFTTSVVDANGDDYTQAGGHPFSATTSFAIPTVPGVGSSYGSPVPVEDIKTVETELPAGFVGNPQAVATCTSAQVAAVTCPTASQVGIARVKLITATPVDVGVYNVARQPGSPAEFGFKAGGLGTVHLFARVRSDGDYGLTIAVPNNAQAQVVSVSLTFWGVPGDPGHDPQRLKCTFSGFFCTGGHPSEIPARAFLTNPADCDAAAPVTTLAVDTWQHPGVVRRYAVRSPRVTGCEQLSFEPTLSVSPDSTQAGAPAGYRVRLSVPQNDNPLALDTPPLRDAVVSLPLGVTLSAAVADGLQGCTDAQFGEHSGSASACPQAAKIGTVQIATPVLDHPLSGSIYIRQPEPGADIRRMYAIFLDVVDPATGIVVKLRGRIVPDAVTGQLTATFDDNPQLPFSEFVLQFKGGPRAPLVNPSTCGLHRTDYALSSWSGASRAAGDLMRIDGNCDAHQAFAPTMSAGFASPAAGGSSPFSVAVARPDGQQDIGSLDVTLPEGVLARIATVPLCADAQAAAGTCDVASQVGTTTVAAGAGASPLQVPQPGKSPTAVYLAGPYKGAPFSLSIVVPAQAGPFDLGTVVVRAALFVDRDDAHVSVKSDPLPTMLQGVPLEIQRLLVRLDRPRFMISPTDCAPAGVRGVVTSSAGAKAAVSSRFQVGECGALPYAPKMSLQVGARGKTSARKRTPLVVQLSMRPGQANNRAVQVTLPKTLNARLDVVNRRAACSIEQFKADRCPQVVGAATAVTPLLRDPLRGPAYFVYNPARRLPDLVVRLKGQVNVDLVGKVRITRALELQTTFDAVPDVPISMFRLALASGPRNGPIGTTRDLCLPATRKALAAELGFTAQSGRQVARSQRITVAGCGRRSPR